MGILTETQLQYNGLQKEKLILSMPAGPVLAATDFSGKTLLEDLTDE